MITHAELLKRIDAHLAASGELPSQFGKRIAGDSNLIRDLRNGRSPRLELVSRIWDATAAETLDGVTQRLAAYHGERG
jgi:hypothetical protein